FSARINVLGVPTESGSFADLVVAPTGAQVRLEELQEDEVYVNTETAAALGVNAGDTLHAYNLPQGTTGDAFWRIRDVTRLGDLGGGQGPIFPPPRRLPSPPP